MLVDHEANADEEGELAYGFEITLPIGEPINERFQFTTDPDVRWQILAAQEAATRRTIDTFTQDNGSFKGLFTRRQKRDAGIIAAIYHHRTTQAGLAVLHAHAIILNITHAGHHA